MGNRYYTPNEVSNAIGKRLQTGEPFSLIRLDNTAGFAQERVSRGDLNFHGFMTPHTLIEGGVWGDVDPGSDGMGHLYKIFGYVEEAMSRCDLLGFVDISGEVEKSAYAARFGEGRDMFFKDGFWGLDPGVLAGVTQYGVIDDPWTRYLKDKRVVVVTTHADSIKSQWKRINKIWGSRRKDIAPFELVDVIRAPFHPSLDDRQYPDCKSWEDTIKHICKLADESNYDVMLAGATIMSPLLADHAKSQGKVGIQTGGVIQMFFGVHGYKWVSVPHFKLWSSLYNDFWISPLESDKPARKEDSYGHLEINYAYW